LARRLDVSAHRIFEFGIAATVEEPSQPKIKRLTLDISETLHKKIKGRAVIEAISMVEMLRELLESTYE
jgi:predicted HicB family RNase H-like nuclease